MPDNVLAQLKGIVVGLTYPSETDTPLQVFLWPGTKGSARAAVQAQVDSTAISEQSVDTFFGDLAQGNSDEERVSALRAMIQETLTGICVFRVHRGTEIDLYLIGRSTSAEWVGIKTMSVET
jgi:hypothetical protein